MTKKAAVPKFVPFRADSIAVSMPDAPATTGGIVHYTPGLSQPWNQRFWAAAHAGLIDPEQEAWCLLRLDPAPGSAHSDALAATAARHGGRRQRPDREREKHRGCRAGELPVMRGDLGTRCTADHYAVAHGTATKLAGRHL